MVPTSDERREVAARLRKAADTDEWLDVAVNNAIFGAMGEVRRPIADTLADLIDPTCEVMEVPDNDELKIRVVSGFMCKRCGHEAIVERNCDGSAEPPRFCPHCGARVTGGGE